MSASIQTMAASASPRKLKISKSPCPKPARIQQPPQSSAIFNNIWYNKSNGGNTKEPAKYRCSITKDTGYTQADKIKGSHICLFFARGLCHRGSICQYLHRLPNASDHFPLNKDCFGRDKFAEYRDDHGGVSTFMQANKTIYVGGIHTSNDAEEVVARHIQEWGPIEYIRVPGAGEKGIAFVTYTTEAHAQFAKDAMSHECLDRKEVLNVRWAMSDPNPITRARQERKMDEQTADAVRAALAIRTDSALSSTGEVEVADMISLEDSENVGEILSTDRSGSCGILSDGTLRAMKDFSRHFSLCPKEPARKRKLVEYTSDEEEA